MPLAAMSAAYQPQDIPVDRLDVKFKPGANFDKVRDAIAIAVGNYTVSAPSVISFPDQRLAQLEIQHAYWALLSPDDKERSGSGVGATNGQEQANYAKYKELATHVELRVENVAFLSADAAALTFRIYYGGSPSPVIDKPQSGNATRVDGHWQLGTNTLCSLAALVGIKCEGDAANVPVAPPTGYEPVSSLDPEDPRRVRDARQSRCHRRPARRGRSPTARRCGAIVAAGVAQDRAYAGKTTLTPRGLAHRVRHGRSRSCTRCRPRAARPRPGRRPRRPRRAPTATGTRRRSTRAAWSGSRAAAVGAAACRNCDAGRRPATTGDARWP